MPTPEDILPQEEKEGFFLIKIFLTLFGIIVVRMFLDNLIYPSTGGYFLSIERFVQEPLYFLSVFFSFSILMYFFTKASFDSIFSFLIKTFLFILLIPLIDLALSGRVTDATQYLYIEANDFLATFFKTVHPLSGQGVTVGQHIGAFFIFICIAWFVYKKTKNIFKGLLALLISYATLFFYAILPSLFVFFNTKPVALDSVIHETANSSALETYCFILKDSWLMYMAKSSGAFIFNLDSLHEIFMSRVFWLMIVAQVLIIIFVANKRIWNIVKNNLPLIRIAYWSIIGTIGMILNYKIFGDLNLGNPVNFISIAVSLVLLAFSIWLAVLINDEEDVEIDKISNPERPLVKGAVSRQEWHRLQFFSLLIVLLGILTMNRALGFSVIIAQSVYYIYSVRPLRLKRHFLFSSILIGIGSVAAAMAGFFLVSPDQHVSAFPIKAILIIGIAYALLSNLKDIKDYDGDKKENIRTLPVVFGLEKSKYIIAALCSLIMIIVPLALKINSMLLISICISIFIFYLFTKKNYQEKYIFLALFVYIITLFLIII